MQNFKGYLLIQKSVLIKSLIEEKTRKYKQSNSFCATRYIYIFLKVLVVNLSQQLHIVFVDNLVGIIKHFPIGLFVNKIQEFEYIGFFFLL